MMRGWMIWKRMWALRESHGLTAFYGPQGPLPVGCVLCVSTRGMKDKEAVLLLGGLISSGEKFLELFVFEERKGRL